MAWAFGTRFLTITMSNTEVPNSLNDTIMASGRAMKRGAHAVL